MLRKLGFLMLLATIVAVSMTGTASASKLWLGGGIHYLRNVDDITEDGAIDLNQNSFSILASAKRGFGLISIDGQLEYIFDYAGTGEAMFQPSIWGLVGGFLYGGLGIGIGNIDGDWQDNPFYALRAGVAVPLDKIELDFYATYRFQENGLNFSELTDESFNSLTLAGIVRFGLGGD